MWLHKHPPQPVHMDFLKDAHRQDVWYASGLQVIGCMPLAADGAPDTASSTEAPCDLEDLGAFAATGARADDNLPAAEVSGLDWVSQGWLCMGATCLTSKPKRLGPGRSQCCLAAEVGVPVTCISAFDCFVSVSSNMLSWASCRELTCCQYCCRSLPARYLVCKPTAFVASATGRSASMSRQPTACPLCRLGRRRCWAGRPQRRLSRARGGPPSPGEGSIQLDDGCLDGCPCGSGPPLQAGLDALF